MNTNSDLVLLYNTIKQLKMKKELPACITWMHNTILIEVNSTMLYHIILDYNLSSIGSIGWQELEDIVVRNADIYVPHEIMDKLVDMYNHYDMLTRNTPFYISDTFKEDIDEMGLKAADGMRKLKINPNCFLSIFNGIVAANKGDDVSISLHIPDNPNWEGMFITKIIVWKKKSHFQYTQYFNSLLV